MEPITPLLRFEVRNPNLFGGARQIGFANAHGADFIVIGVSFLEFAHLATLQDQRFAVDGGQGSDDLEAVAGGFEHEEVLGGGVLLGPTLELGHRHFVKHFFGDRCGRGWSPEQRGGETVRVRVKTDHPLDKRCIMIHLFVSFSYAGGRKRIRRLHALRYAGRSPCRCFSPVLIHGNGELLQA